MQRGGWVFHHAGEGGLELFHFGLRANCDANVSGPNWPRATNENILRSHRCDDFFCGTLHVEHEAVGLRWNEGVAVLREPFKRRFADGRVDLFAIGDESRIFQAGGAAATAVMGMALQPENAPIFSRRSGRAMAKPQRNPAIP